MFRFGSPGFFCLFPGLSGHIFPKMDCFSDGCTLSLGGWQEWLFAVWTELRPTDSCVHICTCGPLGAEMNLEWGQVRTSHESQFKASFPPPPGSTLTSGVLGMQSKSCLVQFSSVAQSCLTLCDPMNGRMPGLPVHHQLLEFTQTHVHRVGDAIQPSHPLSSPSPPAPNPSQHQSLFQ